MNPAKSGITRALGIFVTTIDIFISQSIATPSGFMNRHCASGTYWVMRYQYTNIYRYIHNNTLRPRQNGRHFVDDTFKLIFLIENVKNSTKISLTFIPTGPALVHIMAWRRSGEKPLSEPVAVSLLTHICVTWPQWVKKSLNDHTTAKYDVHVWRHSFNYARWWNTVLNIVLSVDNSS